MCRHTTVAAVIGSGPTVSRARLVRWSLHRDLSIATIAGGLCRLTLLGRDETVTRVHDASWPMFGPVGSENREYVGAAATPRAVDISGASARAILEPKCGRTSSAPAAAVSEGSSPPQRATSVDDSMR